MEMQVTRRFALAFLALGGGNVRPQAMVRELEMALGRESVPITDADGRIAYRFPSFSAVFHIDIGEDQTLQLCCIPGGVGMMGSERQWEEGGIRSTPVHPILISGFLLGRFEVTRGQWLRATRLPRVNRELLVQFTPPRTPEEALWPAEAVSSLQAEEFCDRLARFTGLPCRLPSESEWEYACRAGTSTVYHFGDSFGADLLSSEVISGVRLQPVGSNNAPNRFCLHDMHGGVGEWCGDWSHPDYVGAPADGSPWMSPGGDPNQRIVRGAYTRMGSAGRVDFPRSGFTTFFGLRVAVSYSHGVIDPRPGDVVHGLTGKKGTASPGQIISIRGDLIGPPEGVSATPDTDRGMILNTLAGVQVFVGETAAPILFASKERVDLLMPMDVRPGDTTTIVLRYGWQSAAPISVTIVEAAPGLLVRDQLERGAVLAINENGSVNDSSAPAFRGSAVSFFGSGFGELEPRKPDGSIVNEELMNLPRPVRPTRVWVGEIEAAVEYCGQAPGMVFGVVQVNVRIPPDVPSGAVSIMAAVGDQRSAADVTIWIT